MPFFSAHAIKFSLLGTTKAEIKFRSSPIAKHCSTYLFEVKVTSIGCGATFLPPDVTIKLFFLSVIFNNPSSSNIPMSPEWNHPSFITSAVASGSL